MFSNAYEISTHFLKLFAVLIWFHRKARHCFCYSLFWSWRGLALCLALMVHTACRTCIIWWHYWHTQPTFHLTSALSTTYWLHWRESSSWYNQCQWDPATEAIKVDRPPSNATCPTLAMRINLRIQPSAPETSDLLILFVSCNWGFPGIPGM